MAGGGPPANGGTNVSHQRKESISAREAALGAEYDRDDALVLGRVDAGRTCALGLVERDRLSFERGLDAGVEHVNCKTEACHRVPVSVRADGPEDEAGVAANCAGNDDVLRSATAATTEQATVDDRIVVADLRVGPVPSRREVGQPEVLIAPARRPGGGQLKLATVDEDRIRDHAQRHLVAGAEQAGAAQVVAASVGARALAVVEVAAEVIAGAEPRRPDV